MGTPSKGLPTEVAHWWGDRIAEMAAAARTTGEPAIVLTLETDPPIEIDVSIRSINGESPSCDKTVEATMEVSESDIKAIEDEVGVSQEAWGAVDPRGLINTAMKVMSRKSKS